MEDYEIPLSDKYNQRPIFLTINDALFKTKIVKICNLGTTTSKFLVNLVRFLFPDVEI